MKFKPGDIAWVRHWNDGWSGPDPEVKNDWYLAVWDGVEQVVTVIDYVESDFVEGQMKARVIGADGATFITPDDYLVDEKTAEMMRREEQLNNDRTALKNS